jgi:hypothetical protein
MNKKTKRHTRRHKKTTHKKKTHKKTTHKKRHTKRRLYRKRRELVSLPGSKGLPVFLAPDTKQSNKIHIITNHNMSGNMITGLREYQM